MVPTRNRTRPRPPAQPLENVCTICGTTVASVTRMPSIGCGLLGLTAVLLLSGCPHVLDGDNPPIRDQGVNPCGSLQGCNTTSDCSGDARCVEAVGDARRYCVTAANTCGGITDSCSLPVRCLDPITLATQFHAADARFCGQQLTSCANGCVPGTDDDGGATGGGGVAAHCQ